MPALRPYHPADAIALTDLYARSVRHYGPRAYTPAQVAAWAATADVVRTAARCSDGRQVWVAQDDQTTSFDVLWAETTIATCQISAGSCRFALRKD